MAAAPAGPVLRPRQRMLNANLANVTACKVQFNSPDPWNNLPSAYFIKVGRVWRRQVVPNLGNIPHLWYLCGMTALHDPNKMVLFIWNHESNEILDGRETQLNNTLGPNESTPGQGCYVAQNSFMWTGVPWKFAKAQPLFPIMTADMGEANLFKQSIGFLYADDILNKHAVSARTWDFTPSGTIWIMRVVRHFFNFEPTQNVRQLTFVDTLQAINNNTHQINNANPGIFDIGLNNYAIP